MDIDEFDDLKIILWLILFLVFGIFIVTCRSPRQDLSGSAGPVVPSSVTVNYYHQDRSLITYRKDNFLNSKYPSNQAFNYETSITGCIVRRHNGLFM